MSGNLKFLPALPFMGGDPYAKYGWTETASTKPLQTQFAGAIGYLLSITFAATYWCVSRRPWPRRPLSLLRPSPPMRDGQSRDDTRTLAASEHSLLQGRRRSARQRVPRLHACVVGRRPDFLFL